MKILLIKSKKRFIGGLIFAVVFMIAFVNAIGYVFNIKYISVLAAVTQIDNYQIRSEMLMEAMEDVGVCDKEEAAKIWAGGLKGRSAAKQYSVMTQALKKEYAKQLEKTDPNWVTGVSSPWIESYEIKSCNDKGNDTYIYDIVFSTKTSSGGAGDYEAEITVIKEDGFYRVTKIKADKGLYVYMGFEP